MNKQEAYIIIGLLIWKMRRQIVTFLVLSFLTVLFTVYYSIVQGVQQQLCWVAYTLLINYTPV
jgi:hypothetical protein